MSKDHGLSNNTLSISSFDWKRNITLFSPKSLALKLCSAHQTNLNTLTTDSMLISRLVQNFPMRIGPSSVNGAWIVTSTSSFTNNFNPAHLFVISSMLSFEKDCFYRLHGEKICLSATLMLILAPFFTPRVSRENL